jgi:AcrR family transcriptional regulator
LKFYHVVSNDVFDYTALMKRRAARTGRKRTAPRASAPASRPAAPISTAERIVRAAKALFAERGYEGTYIKDISALAGVNIAAVNYHFESKELLYRHVLESLGRAELTSAVRALQPVTSPDALRARLEVFLMEAIVNVQREPEAFRIVLRETESADGGSGAVYKGVFGEIFETLVAFLDAARREGLLGRDVDATFAAGFLTNQLVASLRADAAEARHLGRSLSDPAHRTRWIAATLDLFLSGVAAKPRGTRSK